MSVRPEQLRKYVVSNDAIATIAREQLSMIDAELRKKVVYGRNVVHIPLETNFISLALDVEDSQRIIYCHIIQSLSERGFEVRISKNLDKVTLYVAFNMNISPEKIESMDKIIQKHQISDEDLELFYTTTSTLKLHVSEGGGSGAGS